MTAHDQDGHRRLIARARRLRQTMTLAEHALWSRLRERQGDGHFFVRQHPVAGYIVDFCCRRVVLIVEVDGGQHAESVADHARTRALESLGYRVLRFWNNDVLSNPEGVLIRIQEALNETPAYG